MIDFFESFLYIISVALFYPVVIGLVLLTFWTVLCLGNFIAEIGDRRKKNFDPVRKFSKHAGSKFEKWLWEVPFPDIEIFEHLRAWQEHQSVKLNRIRFVVRLGPSLGLMGTLIPMGTALASLSQGDMLAMSTGMVTAFTTTIVGIGCGSLAYIMLMVRKSWMRKDLLACEVYAEKLFRRISSENSTVIAQTKVELEMKESAV